MDVTKLRIYEKQKEESVVLSSFAVTRLGHFHKRQHQTGKHL